MTNITLSPAPTSPGGPESAGTVAVRKTMSGPLAEPATAALGATSSLRASFSGTINPAVRRSRRAHRGTRVAPQAPKLSAEAQEAELLDKLAEWEPVNAMGEVPGSRVSSWIAVDQAPARSAPRTLRAPPRTRAARMGRSATCPRSDLAGWDQAPVVEGEEEEDEAEEDGVQAAVYPPGMHKASSVQLLSKDKALLSAPLVRASPVMDNEVTLPTESIFSPANQGPWKWLGITAAIFTLPIGMCMTGAVFMPLLAIPAVLMWLVAEGVFVGLRTWQLKSISRRQAELPIPCEEEQQELFQRVMHLRVSGVEPSVFLSRWFHGKPADQISLDGVRDFLACQFYHRMFKDLPARLQAAVVGKVDRLERELNFCFKREHEVIVPHKTTFTGRMRAWLSGGKKPTNGLPFMAHTIEPLRAVVHPLALYAWGHSVGAITVHALASLGFTCHTSKVTGFNYFVLRREKAHVEGDEEEQGEACVFVHGLGIGITPYLVFVYQVLMNCPHKTVIVMELPHIAFRLTTHIPAVEKIVDSIEDILDHTVGKDSRCSILGHSFGSLVCANFVRTRPERVASLGLIDPVSVLLCLPDVVYNFIYKAPEGVVDAIRTIMVAREINVAQSLCRVFNWHALLLWAHQMPPRTLVMLSGKDSIVPSPEVRRYLHMNNVPVVYNEAMVHAEFLVRPDLQRGFLRKLYEPTAPRPAV